MKKKLLFVAIMLIVNIACGQKQEVPSIVVNELVQRMESDSSLVILDVRTPQELVGPLGKIDGVINIPVQELNSRIGELHKFKNSNIAVICRSGNRSVSGTKILMENGFKAENVKGGMKAYRNIKQRNE